MTQRLYLTFNAASFPAPVGPAFGSQWQVTTNANRLLLARQKKGTALSATTGTSFTETGTTSPLNMLHRQFVSEPLPAQTIAGTLRAALKGLEGATTADASMQIVARVVSGDGLTQRGVLYAGHTAAFNATVGALGEELATSQQWRLIPKVTLTPVDAQAGDRLVVEVGVKYDNTTATSASSSLTFGDANATVDAPFTSGPTTTGVPWVEFSQSVFAPETWTSTGRGGAPGDNVATTDTGNGGMPTTIDVGATASMKYVLDASRGVCYEMKIGTANENSRMLFDAFAPMFEGSASFYVKMTDAAIATARFFSISASNSGAIAYLGRATTSNRPTILNSASGTSGFTVGTQPPAATNLSPYRWRRVELTWERSATVDTTYSLVLTVFDGDSTTPLGSLTTDYNSAPSDAPWRLQVGIVGGTTAPTTMRFSSIRLAQGSKTAALGPDPVTRMTTTEFIAHRGTLDSAPDITEAQPAGMALVPAACNGFEVDVRRPSDGGTTGRYFLLHDTTFNRTSPTGATGTATSADTATYVAAGIADLEAYLASAEAYSKRTLLLQFEMDVQSWMVEAVNTIKRSPLRDRVIIMTSTTGGAVPRYAEIRGAGWAGRIGIYGADTTSYPTLAADLTTYDVSVVFLALGDAGYDANASLIPTIKADGRKVGVSTITPARFDPAIEAGVDYVLTDDTDVAAATYTLPANPVLALYRGWGLIA